MPEVKAQQASPLDHDGQSMASCCFGRDSATEGRAMEGNVPARRHVCGVQGGIHQQHRPQAGSLRCAAPRLCHTRYHHVDRTPARSLATEGSDPAGRDGITPRSQRNGKSSDHAGCTKQRELARQVSGHGRRARICGAALVHRADSPRRGRANFFHR